MTRSGGTANDKKPKTTRQGRGARAPVDAETKARILAAAREAAEQGTGTRNSIAREWGIDGSTLTRWCKQAVPPITWDRTATAQAVEAHSVDMKARRVALAEGLLDDVVKLRDMLFVEVKRTHYSVTNGEVQYTTPTSPGEIKDLLVGIGIAIDKHVVLARIDTDDRDLAAVDAWLAHMMGGAQ